MCIFTLQLNYLLKAYTIKLLNTHDTPITTYKSIFGRNLLSA